jgi:hypothetical protein
MNNYLIDANIYSFPDVENLSLEEKEKKYEEFVERISVLYSVLKPPKRDIKLYFFRKDIKSLRKAQGLFTKEKCNKMKQSSLKIKNDPSIDDLLEIYSKLIENLITSGYDNVSGKDYSKYITIEEHLCMRTGDIDIENTMACDPEIENLYSNYSLMKDFNKKLLLLTFLNRYIYRDSTINKMVTNGKIPGDKIRISANVSRVTHNFLIDDIPETNFTINKQTVEFSQIENINSRKQLSNIKMAYFEAKTDFSETLDFSAKVEENIAEYENIVLDLEKHNPNNSKIKNHLKESPYTLYDHLDSLDRLVKYYKSSNDIAINKRKPIMERYRRTFNDRNTCYSDNLVCKKCCALLRFCRYNCSVENVKEEGKIDDKQFQIHLKPYSYGIDGKNKDIADLSLRIYFRWDTDKINIGYIGKHL